MKASFILNVYIFLVKIAIQFFYTLKADKIRIFLKRIV